MLSMYDNGIIQNMTSLDVYMCCRYRHPNIVQILGICCDDEVPAIIMENMEGGSLFIHLHEVSCNVHRCGALCVLLFMHTQKHDMPYIGTRIRVLHQTAQGLAYLHCSTGTTKPLIHLDVKR